MEIYIRNNDSLWYFSQLFSIPLQLIEKSNPLVSANNLIVGQRIQIPGFFLKEHIVKENQTLWTIAMNQNLPIDFLLLSNHLVDPTNLQVGQTIFIPQRVNEIVVTDVNNYTFAKMTNDLRVLMDIYPFISNRVIGHSVMGKDIIELQIGEGEKNVHINGSFHANEWITTPIIMRFLNQYALSLTNNLPIRGLFMPPLYNDTLLSIVPMVNPDGVNLVLEGSSAAGNFEQEVLAINGQQKDFSDWKANINGVDLNNQFPALWEVEAERKPTTPQPRDYPGPYPLSEPEAVAMAELTWKSNFQRVNAFHTQGEEIYWGFEGLEPPVSETIVNEYARVSGYKPIRYIDSYAGYKDWFIQDFRRPGFTIELGKGVNPLSIVQFPEIYEKSLGIMLANLYV